MSCCVAVNPGYLFTYRMNPTKLVCCGLRPLWLVSQRGLTLTLGANNQRRIATLNKWLELRGEVRAVFSMVGLSFIFQSESVCVRLLIVCGCVSVFPSVD